MARVSSGKDSKQDYGSPIKLIENVNKYFPLKIDLAAHKDNHKCDKWFGPGGVVEDSLEFDWNRIGKRNWFCWLNPPYGDIGAWYEKCKESNIKIISLVPLDSPKWFINHVVGNAAIIHLKGRIAFEGTNTTFPKDCMLNIWGIEEFKGIYTVWDWKNDKWFFEFKGNEILKEYIESQEKGVNE